MTELKDAWQGEGLRVRPPRCFFAAGALSQIKVMESGCRLSARITTLQLLLGLSPGSVRTGYVGYVPGSENNRPIPGHD